MTTYESANKDQIEYWNGRAGNSWASEQESLDRSLAPFGNAAIAKVAPKTGERVLDVGCGAGATAIALAEAVGASGSVLGIDVSAPMLARARARGAAFANVRFLEADAALHTFAPAHDLLFSRMGVMFFADPIAAFTNLRSALAPHGRLAFVCWRPLSENPWMQVPLRAAQSVIGVDSAPPNPHAPGPMAFADPDRVKKILTAAGFDKIEIEPFTTAYVYSTRGLDFAVANAMKIGPTARAIAEAPEALHPKAREAVCAALSPHLAGDTVSLQGGTWTVTASPRS
jgi:SAM-dependent methyltransferase